MDESREKLIAAIWQMWGAISQSRADDIYNEKLNSLYEIGRKSMIYAGQIEDVDKNTESAVK